MFNYYPLDTGRKLNVHKTLRRRPGRLLNVLCTFILRPVSRGILSLVMSYYWSLSLIDSNCTCDYVIANSLLYSLSSVAIFHLIIESKTTQPDQSNKFTIPTGKYNQTILANEPCFVTPKHRLLIGFYHLLKYE